MIFMELFRRKSCIQ